MARRTLRPPVSAAPRQQNDLSRGFRGTGRGSANEKNSSRCFFFAVGDASAHPARLASAALGTLHMRICAHALFFLACVPSRSVTHEFMQVVVWLQFQDSAPVPPAAAGRREARRG